MADLALNITARNQAQAALNSIGSGLGKIAAQAKTAQQQLKAMGDSMVGAGKALSVGVTAPILGFAGAALKAAADNEQLAISFTTMLGSAEKAKVLMGELEQFAAATPFSQEEVVTASKQLLAFGVTAEDIQPTLTQLGDLAAGIGAPVGDLAYLFGTAKAQGRLFMADVNQFSSRGIPMIEALAATMGVAQTDVRKLIEEGKVGFPEMQQALAYLTGEGSKFGGLMDAQSASLSGLFSTLKDNAMIALRTIGEQFITTFDLKKLIGGDASLPDDKGGIIGYMSRAKDAIINLAKTNPQLFKLGFIIAGVAAAIGPLLIGLGMITTWIAAALPALSAVAGAFSFLLGPIGLVVAALGAAFYFDIGGIRGRLAEIGAWFTKLVDIFQTGEFKQLGGLLVALGIGRTQAYAFGEAIGGAIGFVRQTIFGLQSYAAAVADAGFGSVEARSEIELLPEALQGVARFADQTIFGLQSYASAVRDAGFGSTEAKSEIELLPESLQGIAGFIDKSIFGFQSYAAAVRDAGFGSTEAKDEILLLPESLQGIVSAADSAAAAIQRFVTGSDFTAFTTTAKQSFGDVSKAFGELFTGEISLGEFGTKIKQEIDDIGASFRKMFEGDDLGQLLADFGLNETAAKDLVTAIDGIKAAFDRVSENVTASGTIFDGYFERLKAHLSGVKKELTDSSKGIDFSGSEASSTSYFDKLRANLAALDEQGKGVGKSFNDAMTWDFGAVDKAFNDFTGIDAFFDHITEKSTGMGDLFTWDFAATDEAFNTWLSRAGASFKNAFSWDFSSVDAAFNKMITGTFGGIGGALQKAFSGLKWPDLSALKWPTLPDLSTLKWPTFTWPTLPAWSWPTLPTWTWPTYLTFTWPTFPTWTWPTIPTPGWIDRLLAWSPTVTISNAIGGLFGNNANGTDNWKGGWTWVGEKGPELVNLPKGAQVLSNTDSMGMIGQLAAGTTSLGDAMQNVSPIWRKSDRSGGQLTGGELIPRLKETVMSQVVRPIEDASKTLTKGIKDGAKELEDAMRSAARNTPGLFSTSEVTQEQLDLAKLGVPQNFADDWIRHLTDEVVNGVDWADADIKDAAMRAGIDPGLPAKVILDMVKSQWNDQSFFANGNTDLINLDAFQEQMRKEAASKAGEANLLAFLGIPQEQVAAQGKAVGKTLRTGIAQAMTASTTEGEAGSLTNFGTDFANIINNQLEGSEAFAATGSAILTKIVESWSDLRTIAVDLVKPIADAINAQLDTSAAIDVLKNTGARMVKIVFQGFDEEALGLNWVGSVASAANGGTTTVPDIPGNANGTSNWRGGLSWVGERGPELVNLPRGSQVFNNADSLDMTRSSAGGGMTIIVNVADTLLTDTRKLARELAYEVATEIRRKGF